MPKLDRETIKKDIAQYTKLMLPELLTVEEAAKDIFNCNTRENGVSPRRVRSLILSGDLPAVKPGNDYFVLPADIGIFNSKQRGPGRPSPN